MIVLVNVIKPQGLEPLQFPTKFRSHSSTETQSGNGSYFDDMAAPPSRPARDDLTAYHNARCDRKPEIGQGHMGQESPPPQHDFADGLTPTRLSLNAQPPSPSS